MLQIQIPQREKETVIARERERERVSERENSNELLAANIINSPDTIRCQYSATTSAMCHATVYHIALYCTHPHTRRKNMENADKHVLHSVASSSGIHLGRAANTTLA
jgi:hypothetical protein